MKKKSGKLVIIALAVIILIWVIWGNITVGVTNYTVSSDRLPQGFDHYKIAVVSDLHNGEYGEDNRHLLSVIQKESPDMIAVTGDLVDSSKTNMEIAERFIKKLVEIAHCYYVTGNHEAWLGERYQELEKTLKDMGVVILHDSSVRIMKDNEMIQIAGLDDPDFIDRDPSVQERTLKTKLEEMKITKDYCILLSHRPEFFKTYVSEHVDLVLSGHTHGGQFRLPLIGGIIAPNQGIFPKYDAGKYSENSTTMIVSRGIGNSIVPVRFNNRPEVVIAELRRRIERKIMRMMLMKRNGKRLLGGIAVVLSLGMVWGFLQSEDPICSEQEVMSMFSEAKGSEWEYISHVLTPDCASDRVGAVLFRDKSKETVNVAFFDQDGGFQQCGISAELADQPEFEYLGDGTVAFKIKAEDGQIYPYKITISVKGNHVDFKADTEFIEKENTSVLTQYDSVLSQYRDMVQNDFYMDLRDSDDYDSSFGEDIGVEIRTHKQDIYSAFYDIDGNGIMELLIAGGEHSTSNPTFSPWNYDLYGYDGTKVVSIFPEMEFGYRTNFSLYEHGVIEVFYSSSAAESGIDFYRIGEDGVTPELIDSFSSVARLEGDKPVFTYYQNGSEITKEEYSDKIQGYEIDLEAAIDWTQIR